MPPELDLLQGTLDVLVLPRPDLCPELIDELEAFEFSVTDSGTVRTGAPWGVHDDTVIALALACWWLQDLVEPKIEWIHLW